MRQPNPVKTNLRPSRGFSLIELLIAIGILVGLTALALPAILHARKVGVQTRVRSDLALISTALEAYRGDFRGDYPQFSTPAEDYTAAQANSNTSAAYPWLDYRSYRGAVLLCRALVGPGPGPAPASAAAAQPVEVQGEDGADGPGSRNRRLLSQINGVWVTTGKVFGPYVDSSKFKMIKFAATDPDGCQMLADSSGNPILYYPAYAGTTTTNLFNFNPQTYSPTDPSTNNITPARFNSFDNQAYLDAGSFSTLAASCGTLPYLLWTAGIDGKFGVLQGKTDDIANFDLPLSK